MQLKRKIACAAALLAVPFVLDQGVASAATTTDTKSQTITFTTDTVTPTQMTCTFTATGKHNPDVTPNTATATSSSACRGKMTTDLLWTDENGVAHKSTGVATSTRDLTLTEEHAASKISATHTVSFTGCNTAIAQTCSITLHTAPK